MSVQKYRKKPVVIEALQLTPDVPFKEISDFCLDAEIGISGFVYIKTLEGTMTASVYDYLIKDVKGEFYPCKPGVFEATYEAV